MIFDVIVTTLVLLIAALIIGWLGRKEKPQFVSESYLRDFLVRKGKKNDHH